MPMSALRVELVGGMSVGGLLNVLKPDQRCEQAPKFTDINYNVTTLSFNDSHPLYGRKPGFLNPKSSALLLKIVPRPYYTDVT